MEQKLATPLAIIQSFFEMDLDRRGLKRLLRLKDSDDRWIDFAIQYADTMEKHCADEFLSIESNGQSQVRLYFEPRLREQWAAATNLIGHPSTPLLGARTTPEAEDIDTRAAAVMLGPLKKHLLVGDSVYIRDTFYYCFDLVKGCVSSPDWRENRALSGQIPDAVRSLKAWLPLLRHLGPLIETDALVFMPDYMTPSWPYDVGDTNEIKAAFRNLRLQPDDNPDPPAPPVKAVDFERFSEPPHLPAAALQTSYEENLLRSLNEREIMGAWINAKLMGLDSVYPSRRIFDFASRLYLAEENGPGDVTCDLTSLDIVPLGHARSISIKDLVSLRKNEEGFTAVREAVLACQAMLRQPVESGADATLAIGGCKELFDERIATHTGPVGRVLRRAEVPAPNTAITLAVGVALIPTVAISPFLAPVAGVVLAPTVVSKLAQRFNAPVRALTSAKALL
jgi:hypothetical protein